MIHRFNAFSDNYIWGIDIRDSLVLVDPGESTGILKYLKKSAKNTKISAILITHRHHDHVGGIRELVETKFFESQIEIQLNGLPVSNKMRIFGPSDCQKFGVENVVSDGDILTIGGCEIEIIDIPGHTEEHVGYLFKVLNKELPPALFCGDTLFGGGCGRVLGGKLEDLYQSLKKIALLPPKTLIYCAHEYTEKNLKFANQFFPDNEEIKKRYRQVKMNRDRHLPTIPTVLSCELDTNPYLTCKNFDEFKEIRLSKDNWKG